VSIYVRLVKNVKAMRFIEYDDFIVYELDAENREELAPLAEHARAVAEDDAVPWEEEEEGLVKVAGPSDAYLAVKQKIVSNLLYDLLSERHAERVEGVEGDMSAAMLQYVHMLIAANNFRDSFGTLIPVDPPAKPLALLAELGGLEYELARHGWTFVEIYLAGMPIRLPGAACAAVTCATSVALDPIYPWVNLGTHGEKRTAYAPAHVLAEHKAKLVQDIINAHGANGIVIQVSAGAVLHVTPDDVVLTISWVRRPATEAMRALAMRVILSGPRYQVDPQAPTWLFANHDVPIPLLVLQAAQEEERACECDGSYSLPTVKALMLHGHAMAHGFASHIENERIVRVRFPSMQLRVQFERTFMRGKTPE